MTKQVAQNGHASYWKIQLQIIAFMRVLKFQSITIFFLALFYGWFSVVTKSKSGL